jgi:hypothetical protein
MSHRRALLLNFAGAKRKNNFLLDFLLDCLHICYVLGLTPSYSHRRSLIRVPLDDDDEDSDEEEFEEVVDNRGKVSRPFDFLLFLLTYTTQLETGSVVNHYLLPAQNRKIDRQLVMAAAAAGAMGHRQKTIHKTRKGR